jgi:hypothetical protein
VLQRLMRPLAGNLRRFAGARVPALRMFPYTPAPMRFRSLAPLLKLCAVAVAFLVLIDAALFRSGLYFRVVKPDSTVGSVVNDVLAIRHFRDPARKNILVLGNSKIGEGFSALIADATSGRSDLHFVNGSVAGTTPRSWYYLLRKVDPDADRFAAVALMVDYDVATNPLDLTNYSLDTSYTLPLLRLADIQDYPDSFTTSNEHARALRAILLPLQALHDDARNLLAHPIDRVNELHRYRKGWLYSVEHYPGRDGTLPPLDIDEKTGLPDDWSPVEATLRPLLEGYFHGLRQSPPAETQAANTAYLREWLGRIARRYAGHDVPVIAFVVPRGPWHRALAPVPVPSGPVAELAATGSVQLLPGSAFVDLEQPQYFFDSLHMNRRGREAFSQMFAQQVAPLVR